jgi:hypothetical protein
MTALLTYLVMLPLSVWLLGSVFGLIDHDDRATALRRIAWRSLPLLAFALVMGSRAATPIAAALLTVLIAHTAWFFGGRLILRRGWLAEARED